MKIGNSTLVVSLVIASALNAQSIDGLYQPSGADWSCSPDSIGMDGGALAIQDGIFDGVENRCELTSPTPVGSATQFLAVCSGEGTTYTEEMVISPTHSGVTVMRDGFSVSWDRCDAAPSSPQNSRWTFGGGQGVFESATRDVQGNEIIFTCNDIGENGGLSVYIAGQPIAAGPVEFDVDGETFPMAAMADGGQINTECSACAETYIALWEATAAGNLLSVRAQNGGLAVFSLSGSREALGDQVCLPNRGF